MHIYDFHLKANGGEDIRFADYRGKKILIVNTASQCGLTPQYEQLQALYHNFNEQLVIIACPSNDFGHQEPGTDSEIAHFCQSNYQVSFPISSKLKVLGTDRHPLYTFLYELSGDDVSWNFQKFLFDEQGNYLTFFAPPVEPLSDEVLGAIGVELT